MKRHGPGSRYQRLLKLEAQHLKEGKQLSEEQIKSIEKANPCFKERYKESKAPDCLHTGKLPDHAALSLHNDVLAFYKKHVLERGSESDKPLKPLDLRGFEDGSREVIRTPDQRLMSPLLYH